MRLTLAFSPILNPLALVREFLASLQGEVGRSINEHFLKMCFVDLSNISIFHGFNRSNQVHKIHEVSFIYFGSFMLICSITDFLFCQLRITRHRQ